MDTREMKNHHREIPRKPKIMESRLVALDLFSGKGGWTDGLMSAGLEHISVSVLCRCTFSPNPHFHTRDNFDAPWNWEKTHDVWAKIEPKSRPRAHVVNGQLQIV